MKHLRKFSENKDFEDIKNDIKGLSVDLVDVDIFINSIYELYDGGICAYYHVNKPIYLDDNLIDNILTIISYGEVIGYKVSLKIDTKDINIEEFPNETVYQSLELTFK